jgi:hypothetical protein
MNVYLSSSWKNREQVRNMATKLRALGHDVYDFTDSNCRESKEVPPERFPEQFDPDVHVYKDYINKLDWLRAVTENKRAIVKSDLIILILPCGIDAHSDWAYGVGLGKRSVIVGHPQKGERSPVHLWANKIFDTEREMFEWLANETKCIGLSVCGGGCSSCLANQN